MNKLIRILSIDGGGIRGILPGQILVSLEEKLKEKTGIPDTRLADYFDFIAGTSTGGILTCIYLCPGKNGRPAFSAQEAVNLYLNNGENIFKTNLLQNLFTVKGLADEKFSAKELEKALEKYFGDLRLQQLIKPCLITSYDISRRKGHFFGQHKADDAEKDFYVKDVTRATSAAPTYFQAAMIHSRAGDPYALIDGGVFANNPALCAYAEVRQLFESPTKTGRATASDLFMLSVGTGEVKKTYDYSEAKDYGKIGWLRPVIDIMMSGVSETVDFQLRQMFDAVGKPENYIRINPVLGAAKPDMDCATRENLDALKDAGMRSAEIHDSTLDLVADRLLETSLIV